MGARSSGYRSTVQALKWRPVEFRAVTTTIPTVETLALRIRRVVAEGIFPSIRSWALATNEAVHPNSLNDLARGRTTNPQHDTIVALANAAGVRVAWLQHGEAPMKDPDPHAKPRADVYPSRAAVVQGLLAGSAPASVIDTLLAVDKWTTDPGAQVWLRLAADAMDEFERTQRNLGHTR